MRISLQALRKFPDHMLTSLFFGHKVSGLLFTSTGLHNAYSIDI